MKISNNVIEIYPRHNSNVKRVTLNSFHEDGKAHQNPITGSINHLYSQHSTPPGKAKQTAKCNQKEQKEPPSKELRAKQSPQPLITYEYSQLPPSL